jgi:hypothetical protein
LQLGRLSHGPRLDLASPTISSLLGIRDRELLGQGAILRAILQPLQLIQGIGDNLHHESTVKLNHGTYIL